MAWKSKFVVFRPDANNNSCAEVFHSDDIQKANYWIKYIALAEDALFTTPAHPKNQTSKPTYRCHKVQSGTVETNQSDWEKRFGAFALPEAQN